MRADLQGRIAPMVKDAAVNPDFSGNAAPSSAKDSNDKNEIDFASLLGNSNREVSEQRKAEKNGTGLGAAKDNEEFFEMLKKQTNQKPTPKNTLGKDEFLKLFVAQLQNQNPLKPKEDTEMAAQLAQFNGLEQMMNVNEKLEELNATQKLGQAVNLINYVGKEITVDNGKSYLKQGVPEGLHIVSKVPVTKVEVELRNESGVVVSKGQMNSLKSGTNPVDVTFKAEAGELLRDGVYTVSAKAFSDNGDEIPVQMESTTKVTGISIGEDGKFQTAIGAIATNEVRSVAVQEDKRAELTPPTPAKADNADAISEAKS